MTTTAKRLAAKRLAATTAVAPRTAGACRLRPLEGRQPAPAPETPKIPPVPGADGENACNGEFNPVNDADAGSRSVQRDAVSAARR